MLRFLKYSSLLVLFTPFLYSGIFYESFLSPKYLFFALAMFSLVLFSNFKPRISIFFVLSALLWVFFFLNSFSKIHTVNIYLFLGGLIYYFYIFNLVFDKEYSRLIHRSVILVGIIIATEGLLSSLLGYDSAGFLGSHKFSSMICLISIGEILLNNDFKKIDMAIMLYILSYPILDTSLGIRLSLLIIGFSTLFRVKMNKKYVLSLFIFITIIGTIFSISRFRNNKNSYSFRVQLWKASLKILSENIFGIGFSGFESTYNIYRSKEEFLKRGENTVVENAHNDIITIIVEGGIFSIIIIILFMFYLLRSLISLYHQKKYSLLSMILAICILMFTSYPFRMLPVFLFISIPFARTEKECSDYFNMPLKKSSIKIIFFFILIPVFINIFRFSSGDYYLMLGLKTKNADILKKGANMRNDYMGWYKFGAFLIKDRKYEEAIKAFKQSLYFNPFNPNTYSYIGYAFMLQNDFKRSLMMYEKAHSILPWSKDINGNIIWLKNKIKGH